MWLGSNCGAGSSSSTGEPALDLLGDGKNREDEPRRSGSPTPVLWKHEAAAEDSRPGDLDLALLLEPHTLRPCCGDG